MKLTSNYGWELTLTGEVDKLTEIEIEQLKAYDDTIYHNDLECYYWMFDFKIGKCWFSTSNIDMCKHTMNLEVFQ